MKKFIHIDMDCFYAAVEMRDNPALTKLPIAIGGNSRRGVLCTANYVARQFGVRAAMSNYQAKKLCPDLVMIPGRMDVYKNISKQIRAIFYRYTDLVEPLSLDEAYLDVTDCQACFGSATLIARQIRDEIFVQTQLTASAGIAPVKFIAKIASDLNKPNGQFVVEPSQVQPFLAQLALQKIPGVGKVTFEKLKVMGLLQGQDVIDRGESWMLHHLGQFGLELFRKCAGKHVGQVNPDRTRKSLSVEHTYEYDLTSYLLCEEKLSGLLIELQVRLEKQQLLNRIGKLSVKVKFSDFVSTTADFSCSALNLDIFKQLLFKAYSRGGQKGVRLLGIGVGLADEVVSTQLSFEC